MKHKRILSTTLLTTACMFGATQPAPPTLPSAPEAQPADKKVAELGEKAPAFSLKDQHGKTHKLADYKGKIVVLEWFSEKCPYCRKTWESGQVPTLIKTLGGLEKDVVYIAMNSTANRPEEEIITDGTEFLKELESPTTLLFDYNGEVGQAYGAKTTPHMFVIDAEGVLVFQGAYSDDRKFKKGDDAEIYVLTAVKQLIAGEEVSPNYVKAWGCGIKYAGGKGGRGGRGARPKGRPGY